MAKRLRPTGARLLVLPMEPAAQTSGGIFLAEHWKTPSGRAVILAVGERVGDETLKPGAHVLYNWINGIDVEHDGQKCRLLHREEILGVIA